METNISLRPQAASCHAGSMLRSALKLTGRIYYPATPIIDSYTESELLPIHESIEIWSRIVIEYHLKNAGFTSSKGLFRFYMNELGMTAPKEFEDLIKDGDIVEVYGSNGKRLFFHPEVFDYSSYNPEDLFSNKWWELYRRDSEITKHLMEVMRQVFFGEKTAPFKPELPNHTVAESSSPRLYSIDIDIIRVSPVYMGGKVVAIASLNRFTML